MEEKKQLINLNIQPQANIYALFSRLNYQEWYALAEFVDNSTASYYAHINDFENIHFDKLVVDISYDPLTEIITIEDNAYGMELEEFKRAILLGNKIKTKSRNEFGYGLKTAATWFGNHWTVESTQLNSSNCYKATIDIDELVSEKKNTTDIHITQTEVNEHYTKITISKLNRKLNTKKIKNNIINILNNMYRRDLKSGKIEIIYNGTTLSFGEFPILNFRNKSWKKDLLISFEYEGNVYEAKGFVGIMEPGGYDKTGFALFRNNRAIMCNYKPSEIFGSQPQTQISLKLFGEIDMDNFEVNQAKDGFSWSRDLEEKFIENLKNAIPDFINVAKMSKKEREIEKLNSQSVDDNKETEEENEYPTSNGDEHVSKAINGVTTTPSIENIKPNTLTIVHTNYDFSETFYKFIHNDIIFAVKWKNLEETKFLYKFNNEKNELIINLNHEYIKTIAEEELKKTVSRVILAYVLSEQTAKQFSNEQGYVKVSAIHNNLDKILYCLKEVK